MSQFSQPGPHQPPRPEFQPPQPSRAPQPPSSPDVPLPVHPEAQHAPDTAPLAPPTADMAPPPKQIQRPRGHLGALSLGSNKEAVLSSDQPDRPAEDTPPSTPTPTNPVSGEAAATEQNEVTEPPAISDGPVGPGGPPTEPPVPSGEAPEPFERPAKLPDFSRWDDYVPTDAESSQASQSLVGLYGEHYNEQFSTPSDPDGHHYRLRLPTDDGEARVFLHAPHQGGAFTVATTKYPEDPDVPPTTTYHQYRAIGTSKEDTRFVRRPAMDAGTINHGAQSYENGVFVAPERRLIIHDEEIEIDTPVGAEESSQVAAILTHGVREGNTLADIDAVLYERKRSEPLPGRDTVKGAYHLSMLVSDVVTSQIGSMERLEHALMQGNPFVIRKHSLQDLGGNPDMPDYAIAEIDLTVGMGRRGDIAPIEDDSLRVPERGLVENDILPLPDHPNKLIPYIQVKATSTATQSEAQSLLVGAHWQGNHELVREIVAGKAVVVRTYTAYPQDGKLTILKTTDRLVGRELVESLEPKQEWGDLTDINIFEGIIRDMHAVPPFAHDAQQYRKRRAGEQQNGQ